MFVAIERTRDSRVRSTCFTARSPRSTGSRPSRPQDPPSSWCGWTKQAEEVVIAANPDVEGEATTLYLARLLEALGVKVRASPRGSRWAATSNTPTRSRWRAPCRGGASSEDGTRLSAVISDPAIDRSRNPWLSRVDTAIRRCGVGHESGPVSYTRRNSGRSPGSRDRLTRDAGARVVFLVDKNGQLIASAGQAQHLDTTSLASLTAGNVAAMGGLAKLMGENEFPSQFHEGERESLHMSIVGGKVVLVVIFDSRSSLGLVRLRVKKASVELAEVFARIMAKVERERSQAGTSFESPLRRDHGRGHRQPLQRVTTRRGARNRRFINYSLARRSTARSSTTGPACAGRRPTCSTSTPAPPPRRRAR